jgi:hypothetical protein
MKKFAVAAVATFLLVAGFLAHSQGAGLTKIASAWFLSGMVDESPIGSVTPSTGAFTNITGPLGQTTQDPAWSSQLMSNGGILNVTQGGYILWNIHGQGDMDFVDNFGLGLGGFGWFASTTTAPGTALMTLGADGQLDAIGGYLGNLTGNASTATALAASPTNCGSNGIASGIAANGNAICNTSIPLTQSVVVTSGICTTSGTAFSSCETTVSWPAAFPDVQYAATCSVGAATALGLTGTWIASKTTTTIQVFIQNGDADAANAISVNEIDCIGRE